MYRLFRRSLPLQELSLLNPALLQINKSDQEQEARQAQRKQEIERQAVVPARTCIDNGAADERANKRARLPNDAEQTEEEEFMSAGCDFRNHRLRVAVPGAYE